MRSAKEIIELFEQFYKEYDLIQALFTNIEDLSSYVTQFIAPSETEDEILSVHFIIDRNQPFENGEVDVVISASISIDGKIIFKNSPFTDGTIPDFIKNHRMFGFTGSIDDVQEIISEVNDLCLELIE